MQIQERDDQTPKSPPTPVKGTQKMPTNNGIYDPYAEWAEAADEGNGNLFLGGTGLIGGIVGVIWDDPSIRPPDPKYVIPPSGDPKVTPPRVKRVKVPPPDYS